MTAPIRFVNFDTGTPTPLIQTNVVPGSTIIGDQNYQILPTDNLVNNKTILSAPRTWTFPLVSSCQPGQRIFISAGGLSATNTVTLATTSPDVFATGLTTPTTIVSTNTFLYLEFIALTNPNGTYWEEVTPTNGIFPTPTRAGDVVYWNGTAWVSLAGNNSGTQFLQENSSGVPAWAPISFTVPTVQRFTSGSSATYTPTAGILYIKVRMCGGGGGGSAAGTNSGSNGNDTSFGSWTAIHGVGGTVDGVGGTGGTGGVTSTGTLINRVSGGSGGGSGGNNTTANWNGAGGGNNTFGGAGGGGEGNSFNGNSNGYAAAANSGGGGGGAGGSGGNVGGSGGGAGEFVEFFMTAAQVGASQTYTVGTGGSGGAAGGNAGGNGAAGIIVIEEYYQ